MKKNEVLLDHQKFLEDYAEKKESVIQIDLDQDLQETAKKVFKETGVCVEEQLRQWIIWAGENPEALKRWKEKGEIAILKELVSLK